MKKIGIFLLSIITLFFVSCSNTFTSKTISILEFNDLHGYIEDSNHTDSISNASYQINKIREEKDYDNTLLLANGDMFQGTGISRLEYGKVVVDIMNHMKFDFFVLGNHEFDWGLNKILNYFDNIKENGEANFPLINSNIYDLNNNLIKPKGSNIYETKIIEKAGIKIGIIGLIGDVKNSISYEEGSKYIFKTDYTSLVSNLGASLKDEGADAIVVSIHGGNSESINDYEFNNDIAKLKYKGNYLVDAVINGHTHTMQKGEIKRDGINLPVIQSKSYLGNKFYSFGRIDLNFDENKKVVSTSTSHIKPISTNGKYDIECENIISSYHEKYKDILDKKITNIEVYHSKSDEALLNYVTNVMLKAASSDIAIINKTGLRSNLYAGDLDYESLYQFMPFDDEILIQYVDGQSLKDFLNNSTYYAYSTKNYDSFNNKNAKVAVIDYVAYSKYYLYNSVNLEKTNLLIRDLLYEDLALHTTFNAIKDNSAYIDYKLNN
jgi:2',3'-cyclic-nucleotide 2'-phosphodiesterase (5'-nucleotidase family)